MIEYIPGLAKVPAAESSISYIDGEKGILEYRGIRIEELARKSNFGEVTYLLLFGDLPTESQLKSFKERVRAARGIDDNTLRIIKNYPKDAHPMAALQASVAATGMQFPEGAVRDAAAREEQAIQFIGRFPTLVAAAHRSRQGLDYIPPDPKLGQAADFLRMCTGETPDELAAHVLDVCLILHADHTMNASTFAARVVASTECELAAALCGAVGSLAGPLHGGANERVLVMLDEIGSSDKVAAWLDRRLENKQKVMGLGHRVYKTKDPRATILQELVSQLFDKLGTSPLYEIATELESLAVDKLGHRGIYPNVDFYSGIVYNKMGIPTDLFTPIFAISRVSGWTAHWLEQMQHNRLFRPTQVYRGRREVPYVPIGERTENVKTG